MGQAHRRPREIIPACVKNRWKKFRGFDGCRGHPRVCGEQYPVQPANTLWLGSSPRVRGAGIAVRRVGAVDGIIPACAGSSRASGREHPCVRDHPRVCGEQELPFAALVLLTGSSPRVRGGGGFVAGRLYLFGIIPAHGEQVPSGISRPSASGSSPRVRGTFQTISLWILSEGIIPARAGSRLFTRKIITPLWDHPRVCGEQDGVEEGQQQHLGSSPRVRGAAGAGVLLGCADGIIPACAGSSAICFAWSWLCRDHPRVCGEQRLPTVAHDCTQGSSPRVRGAGNHFCF